MWGITVLTCSGVIAGAKPRVSIVPGLKQGIVSLPPAAERVREGGRMSARGHEGVVGEL